MKDLKLIPSYLLVAFSVFFLSSCSEDDNPSPFGKVNLTFQSTGSNSFNTSGRMANARTNAAVEITDFQISIRDVVFKTDVEDDSIADDSTDVAFRGPFSLDLLDNTDALSQTIGNTEVPTGAYEELRLKLHKSDEGNADSPLFDRSIFLKGTIDGTPFEMWHDTSENLDVGKSTGVVVDENGVNITVTFDVEQFLNAEVQVNLSDATDGDGDGLIEINTNDDDGNKEIADDLKENIKATADLIDQ